MKGYYYLPWLPYSLYAECIINIEYSREYFLSLLPPIVNNTQMPDERYKEVQWEIILNERKKLEAALLIYNKKASTMQEAHSMVGLPTKFIPKFNF